VAGIISVLVAAGHRIQTLVQKSPERVANLACELPVTIFICKNYIVQN